MINERIGPREDYANLQITIAGPARKRRGKRLYEVHFEIARWRYFDPCTFTVDPARLLALMADPAAYGQALGQAFFAEDGLGAAYNEALAAIQARGDGLRVRLEVEPAELQEILWERIYHPVSGKWLPLGSTALTPFSRFIRPEQWDRPSPLVDRPLRTLVVIASPSNLDGAFHLDPIDLAERQRLHRTLDQIPELAVTYIESGTANRPTLNEIRRHLEEGCHLVHFLCHGVHSAAGTGLFLEDDQGLVDIVDQERMVSAFKVVKTPPVFCFLAACESAARDRHDAMLPLGPALVKEGGVQAVVAMTGKVGLELAQAYAGQFYVRLLKHGVVDLAVNEARALVQDDWDWGVPVLFSRLADNQLIDFPIGRGVEGYLEHTNQAYQAVDQALQAARLEDHGQELLDDLQKLVDELGKSHGLLVNVASKFRRTGQDPQDFAKSFEAFYYDFKEYYDGETWVDEKTSCGQIDMLAVRILPKLAPILDPVHFEQLRQELKLLGNADGDLLNFFGEYLNVMNTAVEAIWGALQAKDLEQAIQLKRDFEAQISPSFQRSKAMFERMSHGIHGVRAA